MNRIVLIVDDDPDFLQVVCDLLQTKVGEVRTDTADSTAAALRLAQHTDYDLIISDIRMPEMDGLALARRISECRPNTPIVLVIAHGDHELGIQALNSGA